jgi:hypothetical protein
MIFYLSLMFITLIFLHPDPSGVAENNTLVLKNADGLVIQNRVFSGFQGNGIELNNCRNITIKNCRFINLSNPENYNGGLGIHID